MRHAITASYFRGHWLLLVGWYGPTMTFVLLQDKPFQPSLSQLAHHNVSYAAVVRTVFTASVAS